MNDLLRCLIREMAQVQTRKLGIVRKSRMQQILDMVSDPPKYAIRFSMLERPGFNPKHRWEEGYGTFMFPLNSHAKEFIKKGNIEFSKQPYAHIFKIPDGLLKLEEGLSTISDETVENFAELYYGKNSERSGSIVSHAGKEGFINHYKDLCKKNYGKNLSFYRTLKTGEILSGVILEKPKTSIILSKLGINGFIDEGEGLIYSKGHVSELSQMVVTNPTFLHSNHIETIKTEDLFRSREILHGKKSASEPYTDKMQSDYYNLLSDDEPERLHVSIVARAEYNMSYNSALAVLNHILASRSQINDDVGMEAAFDDGDEDDNVNGITSKFLQNLSLKLKNMHNKPDLVKNRFSNEQFKYILNKLKQFAEQFDEDSVFGEEITGECNRIIRAIDYVYAEKK
jgi:hypothetical protein